MTDLSTVRVGDTVRLRNDSYGTIVAIRDLGVHRPFTLQFTDQTVEWTCANMRFVMENDWAWEYTRSWPPCLRLPQGL